jgi:hypothetical protein
LKGAQCSLVRRLALLHPLFLRVVVILLGGLLVFFFLPTCKWRRLQQGRCIMKKRPRFRRSEEAEKFYRDLGGTGSEDPCGNGSERACALV